MKRDVIARILAELRAADADMDRIEEAACARLQVHRTDFRCLDILSRHGQLAAGRLGALAGLSTGAATALLDRLESRGYVRRVRDKADRRRVLVEVTTAARSAVRPVYEPLMRSATETFSTFTRDELDVVLRFAESNRRVVAACVPTES